MIYAKIGINKLDGIDLKAFGKFLMSSMQLIFLHPLSWSPFLARVLLEAGCGSSYLKHCTSMV